MRLSRLRRGLAPNTVVHNRNHPGRATAIEM